MDEQEDTDEWESRQNLAVLDRLQEQVKLLSARDEASRLQAIGEISNDLAYVLTDANVEDRRTIVNDMGKIAECQEIRQIMIMR